MNRLTAEKDERIERRLRWLYHQDALWMIDRFRMLLGRYGVDVAPESDRRRWSENDTILITYADTLQQPGEAPLETLHRFAVERLKGSVSTIHILPFCPWSSDDGFSVIDYREVAPEYGDWDDVERLGGEFKLMFDLVLNHCSRRSEWFRQFVTGIAPGLWYFLPTDPELDLSAVVRPRTSPLLTRVATRDGDVSVWTTFGEDQVDLNWGNPHVLFEFLDILFLYLSKGAKILRLDAVAFLWKEFGSDCLHQPETHEIVKLFRDVVDLVAPDTVLLTETNVPHEENVSYFGDGTDEAHMVYNFSLPPLLLYSLLRGDGSALSAWAKTLPDLPEENTFLNFTASHDGVGVRPLQGLVKPREIDWLVGEVKKRGGLVSSRTTEDGKEVPYELNITYVSALSAPGDAELSVRRFLCSQAVMLAFRGVPAVYIHSLLGTPNYVEGVEETGRNRTINRRKWQMDELQPLLESRDSPQASIFRQLDAWLRRRRNHPAFDPAAPMEILDLDAGMFGLVRTTRDKSETIVCVFNFTGETRKIALSTLHPRLAAKDGTTRDILNGVSRKTGPRRNLTLEPFGAYWLVVR